MLRLKVAKAARTGLLGCKSTVEVHNTVSRYPIMLTRNIAVLTEELKKDAEINGGLKTLDSLPGPRTFPVLGNLEHIKTRFNKMHITQLNNAKLYGPMYKDQILMRHNIVVQDPDICKEIYRAEGKLPQRDFSIALGEFMKERQKYKLPKTFADL